MADYPGVPSQVSLLQAISNPVAKTTFQGTITLAAGVSTSLISANVTMASGTALPTTFNNLVLINVGANPAYAFWFGGTASAGAGGELIAAGGSDAVTLGNFATPPTLFSALGTTIVFRN